MKPDPGVAHGGRLQYCPAAQSELTWQDAPRPDGPSEGDAVLDEGEEVVVPPHVQVAVLSNTYGEAQLSLSAVLLDGCLTHVEGQAAVTRQSVFEAQTGYAPWKLMQVEPVMQSEADWQYTPFGRAVGLGIGELVDDTDPFGRHWYEAPGSEGVGLAHVVPPPHCMAVLGPRQSLYGTHPLMPWPKATVSVGI